MSLNKRPENHANGGAAHLEHLKAKGPDYHKKSYNTSSRKVFLIKSGLTRIIHDRLICGDLSFILSQVGSFDLFLEP